MSTIPARLLELPLWIALAVPCFLASTVAFDVVHWSLHRMARSRSGVLRAVGGLHMTHHRFLDRDLRIHPEELRANLRRHVIPEYLTQLATSAALLLFVPLPVVATCALGQTALFAWILHVRGVDVNHRGVERLRAFRPHYFCLPEYHALHHAHPDAHFSSWIKTLDHLLATGTCIRGRRAVLTAADTPFGQALADELEARGMALERLDGPGRSWLEAPDAADRLRDLDVAILLHDGARDGSPAPGEWIRRFRDATAKRRLPPEVWASGAAADLRDPRPSEALRAARSWFRSPDVIYRHLVLPAPARSDALAGPAAARAAHRALAGVRRGLCYVPVDLQGARLFPRFRRAGT